jgi:hypothetical protein
MYPTPSAKNERKPNKTRVLGFWRLPSRPDRRDDRPCPPSPAVIAMPDKESLEGHDEYASLFVLRQEAKRGDATRRWTAGPYLRRMLDAGRRDDQRRTPQLARTSHEDAGFASQWFRRNDVTHRVKITFAELVAQGVAAS